MLAFEALPDSGSTIRLQPHSYVSRARLLEPSMYEADDELGTAAIVVADRLGPTESPDRWLPSPGPVGGPVPNPSFRSNTYIPVYSLAEEPTLRARIDHLDRRQRRTAHRMNMK